MEKKNQLSFLLIILQDIMKTIIKSKGETGQPNFLGNIMDRSGVQFPVLSYTL